MTEFWARRIIIGVKDKNTVWIKKIHLPFVEVGLKEQRPLLMVDIPERRVDTESEKANLAAPDLIGESDELICRSFSL